MPIDVQESIELGLIELPWGRDTRIPLLKVRLRLKSSSPRLTAGIA